mgnify:CR=1 FL=1
MRVVVLCGGLSNERDVSISSGTGIARALREKGHMVALIDLFLGCEGVPEAAFTDGATDDFSVAEAAPDLAAVRDMRPGQGLIGPGVLEICALADIVFLALHGDEGENGKLQAMFDICGIRYTGSGYIGSALAMDKGLTKTVLARETDVPVPGGILVSRGQDAYDTPGFPCVVKPCSGGSSVGTTIVQTPADYAEALELAFRYEDSVVVERYISGRELTVGVLDGKAMPVIEIIPKEGFYDYKNKYQPGMTLELCPAPLTEAETAEIQRLSEEVYHALRLEAYGRVDFIMDEDGVFWCLEANTLPGMTPTSLIPQMGAAMGLDYGELCQRLIAASLKKYE